MSQKFDAFIKTRLPSPMKQRLSVLADARHLATSDLVREALRDFLANVSVTEELNQPPDQKEAA